MKPIQFSFRRASWNDAELLYDLNKASLHDYVVQTWGCWDEAFQHGHFHEHFNPDVIEVITGGGDEAIGFLSVAWEPERAYLASIHLKPGWQGKGIGSAIIQNLLDEARKHNLPVELRVLRVNPARRLYERLGFRVIGETDTHYEMRHD